MENQKGINKSRSGWGWWVLIGVVIVCAVCVIVVPSSSQVNETEPVPIHTTEAIPDPETFRQKQSRGGGGFPAPTISDPLKFALSDRERYAAEIRENYLDYPTDAPATSPPPIWTSPPPIWTSPPVLTSPPPDTEEPECPSEVPGEYPDALDPDFRNCQERKLAACYAQCSGINPLYFFYNP